VTVDSSKVAIITGGAMGIGRYIARSFGEAGYKVAIVDIADMEASAKDVRQTEAEVVAVHADLADEEQVAGAIKKIVESWGRIDVLINNHGIVTHFQWGVPRWPRVKDMDKSFFDKVIDTNLGGTFLTCKHVIPYMEKQGGGHIINFGQGAGMSGGNSIGALAYGTSKAAIAVFSRALAYEEKDQNIVVISMSPGGAIAGEYAPREHRDRMPGPESVGTAFVEAAQLGMEDSGKQANASNGHCVVTGEPMREVRS
jgi:NAD(P)-dependent dehydrogenase (short-subunit alcohol dehydrogenase family)